MTDDSEDALPEWLEENEDGQTELAEQMVEVTVEVPYKQLQKRRPAIHEGEERRSVSLRDGPALAFTRDAVRLYDDLWDTFREFSNRELIEILARVYMMDDNGEVDDAHE